MIHAVRVQYFSNEWMLPNFPKNVVKVKLVLSVSMNQPEQNAFILNDSLSQFVIIFK